MKQYRIVGFTEPNQSIIYKLVEEIGDEPKIENFSHLQDEEATAYETAFWAYDAKMKNRRVLNTVGADSLMWNSKEGELISENELTFLSVSDNWVTLKPIETMRVPKIKIKEAPESELENQPVSVPNIIAAILIAVAFVTILLFAYAKYKQQKEIDSLQNRYDNISNSVKENNHY